MGRSKTLHQVQQFDNEIDHASKRIRDIDRILSDIKLLNDALKIQLDSELVLTEKKKLLANTEVAVEDQTLKIDQNQQKLYSGSVSNPKDLEDLQLESESLKKYLAVLEDRQLEALLEMEKAQNDYNSASSAVSDIRSKMETEHTELKEEKIKFGKFDCQGRIPEGIIPCLKCDSRPPNLPIPSKILRRHCCNFDDLKQLLFLRRQYSLSSCPRSQIPC